jgi:hypothetical protein
MAYIVPSLQETLEDRALYTRGRLAEVTCQECRERVLVRKNSEHHTSIQWTQEAVAGCAVFAELDHHEGGRPVHSGCPRLVASIDDAVRQGAVAVGAGVDPIGRGQDGPVDD